MNLSFQLSGVDAGLGALDRITSRVVPEIAASLYQSAEHVMTVSKEQYVPVDTGTLRSSGAVEIEQDADRVVVRLGFGGAASDYAVAVHEVNKNYKGGRSWKYLETPLNQELPEINQKLADTVRSLAQ